MKKVFIFVVAGLLMANFAWAWTVGEPIVPCGWVNRCVNSVCQYGVGPCTDDNQCWQPPECTQCELWHLLKNLIDFILIAAAPILATLFFVIAGFYMMLGGANPSMLSTGKRMFKDTFIGILIVMLAWLITNTLIQSLADPEAIGGNWWQYSCTENGL